MAELPSRTTRLEAHETIAIYGLGRPALVCEVGAGEHLPVYLCYNPVQSDAEKEGEMVEEQPTPTCRVVRAGETYAGKQGLTYFAGISAESVGASGICMHMLRLPPGARANAHLHEAHETAIYVLSGAAEMWYGERLEQHVVVRAGEYLYIPAGVPHLPYNPYAEEAVAVLARTDPSEQESVVLRPDLDGLHP